MSIARIIMRELKEEGTHHKLEEIYAKIFDEYFLNLEQVITLRQALH